MRLPKIQREILFASLRELKWLVLLLGVVIAMGSVCTVAGPLVFSRALAQVSQASNAVLIGYFALFAATIAGGRIFIEINIVLMKRLEQNVKLRTDKTALAAVLATRNAFFVKNNAARISTLLQGLHQSNLIHIHMFALVAVTGVLDIVLAFAALSKFINAIVAAFVLAYGAGTVWLSLHGNRVTSNHLAQARQVSLAGASLLGNVVSNVVTLKIFRAQAWAASLFDGLSGGERAHWNRFYLARLRYGSMLGTFAGAQYLCIFSLLVLWPDGPDRAGQIVLVSMILLQLNRPFEMLAHAMSEFVVAAQAVKPLQDALDEFAPVQRSEQRLNPVLPAGQAPVLVLDGLSFAHSLAQPPVLRDVCGRFEPGAVNFIVGPSGVGKSTLLQILLHLNDGYQGSVKVAGIELADLDADAFLALIGHVPQESLLMNLSLRDNVTLGRSFSDARVVEVLELVKLGAKLASLPEGLDFLIGERGQLLSGGERQRLAIARALIGAPHILLLDEASSALDEKTERGIFDNLRTIAGTTTVIAVTHRLGVIGREDRVLDLTCGMPQ